MVQAPVGGGSAAAVVASTGSSSRASPAGGLSTKQLPPPTHLKAAPASTNGNPSVPLSAMTAQPLDMSSVERRGQPTAVREPVTKKTRPYDLPEAPTYFPTEQEWKEPMEYIQKISAEASRYGLCKVVPPDSWNPDFAIDTEVSRCAIRGYINSSQSPLQTQAQQAVAGQE